RRRKASGKGLVAVPNGGQMYPTAMPSTSAIRIWAVRPGRRFTTRAHFSFAPGPTRGAERLRLVGRRQLRILDLGRRQTAHERGDHVHHALLLRSRELGVNRERQRLARRSLGVRELASAISQTGET